VREILSEVPGETSAAGDRQLRILLAEDGQINQQVAVGLLEMRGHQVEVAGDGKQAVSAWENNSFDLILMDVQMPEMDGFEATKAIREKENETETYIPIIAMTANAMKGDRERCLEAGMDGYIPKPIERDKLYEAIDEFSSKEEAVTTERNAQPDPVEDTEVAETNPSSTTEPEPDAGDDVFSFEVAEKRIPGGIKAVKQMVPMLISECAKQLDQIRAGLDEEDAKKVQRGAHTIKGSTDVFGAKRVVQVAKQLEEIGSNGDLTSAPPVLENLESEFAALREAIKTQTAADNS